jgi:hypothetical protein
VGFWSGVAVSPCDAERSPSQQSKTLGSSRRAIEELELGCDLRTIDRSEEILSTDTAAFVCRPCGLITILSKVTVAHPGQQRTAEFAPFFTPEKGYRPARSRKDSLNMTLIDVAFRYGAQPAEAQTRTMARVRAVYGIRRMTHDQKERTLRVEYDGSRLSEHVVAGLLRSAGIDLLEKLASPERYLHSSSGVIVILRAYLPNHGLFLR